MLCLLLSNESGGHVKYPIIAVIAVAFLASGCTKKAEGQTVAVVNGEEITVPDLNFALDLAKVPEGADKDKARAQVLQQLVDRRLLAEQAKKEGIDKTPEYLNRERRADEDLLISMLADRRLKTTQLPSDREIQNFMATHPEMFANREIWSLDQVVFAAPTNANLKLQIQGAHSISELIAVLQNNKVAFKQQKTRLDTAIIPPELYAKLSTLAAGEPFALSNGKQMVASAVSGKEPQPLTGDDAKPIAAQAIRKTQTAKSLESMLKSLKSAAKIEYQPGYGPPKKT
jgi:EpsD family peptidyl-prolyl cis-trans isomerase